jgi:hypothetical protein
MALIDTDYFRRLPLGSKALDQMPLEDLQEYLDTASDYVEDYLDHKVAIHTVTERLVGKREYTMILDEYPIVSLTSVTYDGYPGDSVGTHSTSDFLIHKEAGVLEWSDKTQNWRGDRIYTITYTAGYATIPNPIKMAVAYQAVQLLRPMYGGAQAEVAEGVPFADEMIVSLLEKYRRKRLS